MTERSQNNRTRQADCTLEAPKGSKMRFEQMTVDVLAQTPGGAALAQYFGIASTPRQSPEAARRATCLLNMQTNGGPQVFANLDQEIARHNAASGVDPDVLRALMFRFSSRAA